MDLIPYVPPCRWATAHPSACAPDGDRMFSNVSLLKRWLACSGYFGIHEEDPALRTHSAVTRRIGKRSTASNTVLPVPQWRPTYHQTKTLRIPCGADSLENMFIRQEKIIRKIPIKTVVRSTERADGRADRCSAVLRSDSRRDSRPTADTYRSSS